MSKIYNVLFLCTGNSARSIMAEALLNSLGKGRFRAFSGGSHPAGAVNPLAIEEVRRVGYATENLRCKSWDEFTSPSAPHMDFVITVCDKAAGEVCPVWPGQPITAHWGFQDPAAVEGSDAIKKAAFARVAREIKNRLDIFLSLPLDKLEHLAIKKNVEEIGKVYNVLFICTGNSARSVMSEALVTILGQGRFRGFSAGSRPGGSVNPYAIEQIKAFDYYYPTENMRSKSWSEYARPDAPQMDFIITVCDNAAGEECPYWPGHPATAHWGYEDPAALAGSDEEKRALFAKVFAQIIKRVDAFVKLPLHTMDEETIKQEIETIGAMPV